MLLISEQQIKSIINQVLQEKMGVPDKIVEIGKDIFDIVLYKLKSEFDVDSIKKQYDININKNYQIGKYNIEQIYFTLKTIKVESIKKPEFNGCVAQIHGKIKKDKLIRKGDLSPIINIELKYAISPQTKLIDLIDEMLNNKSMLISAFNHEVKHTYDSYMESNRSLGDFVNYAAPSRINVMDIKPINSFLFYLYFTHSIENLVRPTEIYSLIKTNNVTKSEFKDFFEKTKTIILLKQIRNFKFENLKNELKNYKNEMSQFLVKLEVPIYTIPDNIDDLIERFLHIFFRWVFDYRVQKYKDYLMSDMNDFEKLFKSLKGEKQELLNNYIKTTKKYKNYNDFFTKEEKRINFIADRLIRKLSKLYDMTVDNK